MTSPENRGGLNVLTLARRGAVAIGIAGTVAAVLRARGGSEQTVPTFGGWTALNGNTERTNIPYPTEAYLERVLAQPDIRHD